MKKRVPGEEICGVRTLLTAQLVSVVLHLACLIYTGRVYGYFSWKCLLSFLFSIWPAYHVSLLGWASRREVRALLSGRVKINRKYYANVPKKRAAGEVLPFVSVVIAVCCEENAVIFETIRQAMAAVKKYGSDGGRANIVMAEDGLALLLGKCDAARVEKLLAAPINSLSPKEKQAAERIRFYRENHIGFLARPAEDRAGIFKKASNLNNLLRADRREGEAGGYREMDIRLGEILLHLDKDSAMCPEIISAVVPEFSDEKLAFAQCATRATNGEESYMANAMREHINGINYRLWVCQSLMGFFVPCCGHNVFIRKKCMKEAGDWNEKYVPEDFILSFDLYRLGYHGKYIDFFDDQFGEMAGRTFAEESGKQLRYAYGLIEMLLYTPKMRACDALMMILYGFSYLNSLMLIPGSILAIVSDINICPLSSLAVNAIVFVAIPQLWRLMMRKSLSREIRGTFGGNLLIGFFFTGCLHMQLSALWLFIKCRLFRAKVSFPTTSIDRLDDSFRTGVADACEHIRKHKGWFVCAAVVIAFIVHACVKGHVLSPALLINASLMTLAPLLLTPQLLPHRRKKRAE